MTPPVPSAPLVSADACDSLEAVRAQIDRVDRELVTLLAARGAYVRRAAGFKATAADVRAPDRAEAVVRRAVGLAAELGADLGVTEVVYRAMIGGFIQAELAEHARTGPASRAVP